MSDKLSKSKPEPSLTSSAPSSSSAAGSDSSKTLDPGSARVTSTQLSLKESTRLARTSHANRHIFQPLLNEAKLTRPQLTAVVQANPDELVNLVQAKIGLFFKKGEITDPNDTTYYHVSAYQLMIFLCDEDMKDKIVPLIPPGYEAIRRAQYEELGSGGADLVKLDKDPMLLVAEGKFNEITCFITSYNLNPPNPPTAASFSLLENPDGIIFYNNQFYYVNKANESVAPIRVETHSGEEKQALEKLRTSLTAMEPNSSRRSSNNEHQLIASTMNHALIRQGIHYERNAHGADLVKMDKDPKSLQFAMIAPLLENPDGILFYNNNFYYAHKETATVTLLEPRLSSEPKQAALDRAALEALKASFVGMEQKARRSNNTEHRLIARTLDHELDRNTIRYCDSRTDFNRLLNAYRKCIRFDLTYQWVASDDSWRRGVGGAQRDVMWVLQRICEEDRPFDPLPDFKASPFNRSFTIYNLVSNRAETVLVGGQLLGDFGSDFGIYSAGGGKRRLMDAQWSRI